MGEFSNMISAPTPEIAYFLSINTADMWLDLSDFYVRRKI